MIKLIITDDHTIVRHGLRQIIELAPDFEVLREASSGQELLDILSANTCDLVLLDMNMPGLAGVELIEHLRTTHPEVKILILSMHLEGQIASRALKAGAAGYLTKGSEPEVLFSAIRKVGAGGRFIDPTLVEMLVFGQENTILPLHKSLSKRELQVFIKLVSGQSVSEVAVELFLSIKTISTHKLRLMRKIKARNMTDMVRYAIKYNLIDD